MYGIFTLHWGDVGDNRVINKYSMEHQHMGTGRHGTSTWVIDFNQGSGVLLLLFTKLGIKESGLQTSDVRQLGKDNRRMYTGMALMVRVRIKSK